MAGTGKGRLAAAGATVLALGAGAFATAGGSNDGAQAVMLPLEPLPIADTSALLDGHNHFLVRIDPAKITTSGSVTSGAADGVAAGTVIDSADSVVLAESDGGLPPEILVSDLDRLGDRLDYLDGDGDILIAVLTDGTRIAVNTDDSPLAEDVPAATSLVDNPDILEINDVGGGWFAVTTDLGPAEFEAVAFAAGAEEVGEDVIIETASNDEHAHLLWGLDNAGFQSFWGVGSVEDVDVDGVEAREATRGAGVVVAVIDSGSVTDHPDLPSFWQNTDEVCGNGLDDDLNGYVDDCNGWDFFNNDNTPDDSRQNNSHGTHVTGTIAAVPDNGIGTAGLAPGVTVMNLKALQNGSTRMSNTAEAIRYAVDNGAQVINASWGSAGATRLEVVGLEAAIEYANLHGVIVVAASGNDGNNLDTAPSFPASFPQANVISVGALQADGNAASFSNRSTTQVDLHAPGHYIISTVDAGYSAMQGTSMAAPHVTAGIAMVIAENPDMNVADIRAALLDNVDRYPGLAGTSVTGGAMNIAKALGVETGEAASGFQVVINGLDDLTAGSPETFAITTTLLDSDIVHDRNVDIRATLLTQVAGAAFGVVDHTVLVDGHAAVTDDYAQVLLDENVPSTGTGIKAGLTTSLTTQLPEGLYAIVVEVVDAEDPDSAYGPPAVVYALVGPAVDVLDPTLGDPARDGPLDGVPGVDVPGVDVPGVGTPDLPGVPGVDTPDVEIPDGLPIDLDPDVTSPSEGGSDAPSGDADDETSGSPGTAPTTTAPSGPAEEEDDEASGGSGGARAPQHAEDDDETVDPDDDAARGGARAPQETEDRDRIEEEINDYWTITKVSPTWGNPRGGRSLVIHGIDLPEPVNVRVGDNGATVVRQSKSTIIVRTPPGEPGVADVVVIDPWGRELTLPEAYTYADRKPAPRTEREDAVETNPGTGRTGGSDTPGIDDPTEELPSTDDVVDPTVPVDPTDPTSTLPTVPDTEPGDVVDDVTDIVEPFIPNGRARHTLGVEANVDLVPGLSLRVVETGISLPFSAGDWSEQVCVRTSCAALYGEE